MENHLDTYILSPDKEGRKPTILLNIAHDDVTRGDTAGRKGLAEFMAKKIDADILYADEPKLNKLYPDTQGNRTSYEDKLVQFLSQYRTPDIILGYECPKTIETLGKNKQQVHFLADYNEYMSQHILGQRDIVAHHLTDEMLVEEGEKFDQNYPNLKQPIISVFLVNPYPNEQDDFVKKISDISKHYKEATIFLCGSRRTEQQDQAELKKKLQNSVGSNIDIAEFEFDRNADFNPYRGLIARADHFILWGDSMSMMSEPLITGKSVHLYQYANVPDALKKQNIVTRFNDESSDQPLLTHKFSPINITEQLADKLIEEISSDNNERTKHLLHKIRNQPDEWQEDLIHIYYDYQHLKDVSADKLENKDFVLTALSLNGMAYTLLPDEQRKDPDLAVKAVLNNKEALSFVPDNVLDLEKPLLHMVNVHDEIYDNCSDRLKLCPKFTMMLLEKNIDIFEKLDDSLLKQRDIALKIIENTPKYIRHLPKTLLDDPDFTTEALKRNVSCFHWLPETYADDDKAIDYILKEAPNFIRSASERVLGSKTYMIKALKAYSDNLRYVSEELLKDREFIIEAFPLCYISSKINPIHYSDKEIMLLAIDQNSAQFFFCKNALKNDPEICIAAINKDVSIYDDYFFPEAMQENDDVCFALIKRNITMWYSIPKEKHTNKDFILRCAEIKFINSDHIEKELHDDYDFIKSLLEVRPEWAEKSNFVETLQRFEKKEAASDSFNAVIQTTKIVKNKQPDLKQT